MAEFKDEFPEVKMTNELLKNAWKAAFLALYQEVLDGSADIKTISKLMDIIEKHEINVLDEDSEEITSFTSSSSETKINLPFTADLRAINGGK